MRDRRDHYSGEREAASARISRRQLLSTALAGCLGGLLAACSARVTPTTAPATATAVAQATITTPVVNQPTATVPAVASASTSPAPSTRPPTPTATATATAIPPTFTPAPIGGRQAGFGMTMHFMWYEMAQAIRELDQLQAAGLTVARFDLAWRQIEPKAKGEYDLATLIRLDSLLRAMDTRGIRPIITVIETPEWARNYQGGKFTPPVDLQDYADVMAVLARRYAARPSMVWEIWNEPNLIEFWGGEPDPGAYVRLLEAIYTGVKNGNPRMPVLGGALSNNPDDLVGRTSLRTYLSAIVTGDGLRWMDGLSLHAYPIGPLGTAADQFTPALAIARAEVDDDVHIWITETGVPTEPGGFAPVMTPAGQAMTLTDIYEQAEASHDIDAVIYHTLVDPGAAVPGGPGFGFFTGPDASPPLQPKPVVCALLAVRGMRSACGPDAR